MFSITCVSLALALPIALFAQDKPEKLPGGALARFGTPWSGVAFRPGERVTGLAWSPDSKTIASRTGKDDVAIWDAASGSLARTLDATGGNFPWSECALAFSPDGKSLAVGKLGHVRRKRAEPVFDVATGERRELGLKYCGDSVAWSPDGKRFATSSRIFSAESGDELVVLKTEVNVDLFVGFAAGGTRLVTRGYGMKGTLRQSTAAIWDSSSGKLIATLPRTWSASALSRDGKTLGLASEGEVHLFDAATGAELGRVGPFGEKLPENYDDHVDAVALSPDGAIVALGHARILYIIERASGRVIDELDHVKNEISLLAFSPDGASLAVGGWDGVVRIADVAKGSARVARGDDPSVRALAYSHDLIACGGDDGALRAADATAHGAADFRTVAKLEAGIRAVAFAPEANWNTVAAGGEDGRIVLTDFAGGKRLGEIAAHERPITAIAWTSDGKSIVTASADSTVRVFDVSAKKQRHVYEAHSPVRSLALSPDGRVVAAGCADATIKLFDAKSEKLQRKIEGFKGRVRSIAWSPDGKTIAGASLDRALRIFDMTGHKERAPEPTKEPLDLESDALTALAISPEGKLAWVGESYKRLFCRICVGERGELTGHASFVRALAFSPSGARLASASDDGTVILWDLEKRR